MPHHSHSMSQHTEHAYKVQETNSAIKSLWNSTQHFLKSLIKV